MQKNLFMTSGHLMMKVFIVLIVLSTAVWGVGDVFRGGGTSVVATVGDDTITTQELSEMVDQQINQMGQPNVDKAQVTRSLAPQLLDQLVGDSLLKQEAREQGLFVSDEVVIQEISENPKFRDEKGNFSKPLFLTFLRSIGETEAGITKSMKEAMGVRAMLEALMANTIAPPPLLKQMYVYEKEERTARLLRIPASYKVDVAKPSDEELEEYYQSQSQAFSIPEYRDVSYAVVVPEKAVKEVTVSEADIKQYYNEHIAEFTTHEQRELKHMLFETKEAAENALKNLKGGTDFDKVAKEDAKQEVEQTNVGSATRQDMQDTHAEAVFALKKGEVSAPLESDMGWHLFKVVGIKAAETKPLAQVREKLAAELKQEKSTEYLYNLGIRIQDSLAGGNTLEEVASVMGLEVQKLSGINAKGLGKDGKEVKEPLEGFVAGVFSMEPADGAQLMENNKGISYIVRVDKSEPEHTRPLIEVREKVLQKWTDAQRDHLLKELAENTALKIQQGKSTLEAEAKALGLQLETTEPLLRTSNGYNMKVPARLVQDVFTLSKKEDVTTAFPMEEGGYVLAGVASVIPASDAVEGSALESLARKMKNNMMDEAFSQLGTYLHTRHAVDVNDKVLEQMSARKSE